MVKIYSTPTCPKCKMLKKKMVEYGIKYEECDNIDIFTEKGFVSVPWLEVDNELMDFGEANDWIERNK